jgi:hypothetical protein
MFIFWIFVIRLNNRLLCDGRRIGTAIGPRATGLGRQRGHVLPVTRDRFRPPIIGGAAALVCDGENGFVFPLGNLLALSACIRRRFADDRCRFRMGKRSRSWLAAELCTGRRWTCIGAGLRSRPYAPGIASPVVAVATEGPFYIRAFILEMDLSKTGRRPLRVTNGLQQTGTSGSQMDNKYSRTTCLTKLQRSP